MSDRPAGSKTPYLLKHALTFLYKVTGTRISYPARHTALLLLSFSLCYKHGKNNSFCIKFRHNANISFLAWNSVVMTYLNT